MKKVIAAILFVAVVVAIFALQKKEYARVQSPDGAFVAIAEYRAFRAWLPMPPGSGGDKPGWVRLVTQNDALVGEASVPMVSLIRYIRWSKEEASITGVASWKLATR